VRCEDKEPDVARIVATLADEAGAPIDAVAALYERERSALAAQARVTSYLHIFVTRNVQGLLRGACATPDARPNCGTTRA